MKASKTAPKDFSITPVTLCHGQEREDLLKEYRETLELIESDINAGDYTPRCFNTAGTEKWHGATTHGEVLVFDGVMENIADSGALYVLRDKNGDGIKLRRVTEIGLMLTDNCKRMLTVTYVKDETMPESYPITGNPNDWIYSECTTTVYAPVYDFEFVLFMAPPIPYNQAGSIIKIADTDERMLCIEALYILNQIDNGHTTFRALIKHLNEEQREFDVEGSYFTPRYAGIVGTLLDRAWQSHMLSDFLDNENAARHLFTADIEVFDMVFQEGDNESLAMLFMLMFKYSKETLRSIFQYIDQNGCETYNLGWWIWSAVEYLSERKTLPGLLDWFAEEVIRGYVYAICDKEGVEDFFKQMILGISDGARSNASYFHAAHSKIRKIEKDTGTRFSCSINTAKRWLEGDNSSD